MDFVKLRPLPRAAPTASASDETRYFKTFKKRFNHETGASGDVTSIQFNPNKETVEFAVACGTRVSVLSYIDDEVSVLHNWTKHKDLVTSLSYRSDGQLLAAGDASGQANIYSLAGSHGILRRMKGHEGAINQLTFGFGKEDLWTAGKDAVVKLWDVPTGQVKGAFTGHSDSVTCVSVLSPSVTVTAGYDGKLNFLDLRCGLISSLDHGNQIDALAAFPSGGLILSIGPESLKVWDVSRMSLSLSTPVRHSRGVTGAVVSASGDFLWTSSLDGTVKVLETTNMEIVQSFNCGESSVTALAVRKDALVYGTDKGVATYRDRRTIEKSAPLASASNEQYLVAPSTAPRNDSQIDFLLRKFEYGKLMDLVVGNGCSHIQGLSVIDELLQRGALEAGLRNLTVEQVCSVLNWLSRVLVSYPGYTATVVKAVHAVLDVNVKVTGPEVAEAAKKLQARIAQELLIQDKIWQVQGAIETVLMHA